MKGFLPLVGVAVLVGVLLAAGVLLVLNYAGRPSDPAATAARKDVEGFYRDYAVAFDENESVRQRLYADRIADPLKNRFSHVQGYDPVLCAANTPESIRAVGVQRDDAIFIVTLRLGYERGEDERLRVRYDSKNRLLTDVACRVSS